MHKILTLFLTLLLTSSLSAMSKKQSHDETKIDDWDYNATRILSGKKSRNMPHLAPTMHTMAAAPVGMAKNMGFSVGGAKDADNFYENIKAGYLPKVDAITYEGVFYDHYFKSENKEICQTLFCPAYSTAISQNPFSATPEKYLSVGLNSNIKPSDFKRQKLNIVVILDISGSMGAAFDQYYYDHGHKVMLKEEERQKSKMTLANEAIVAMIGHLRQEDRLGVVLFDNQAYHAKPLRLIKETKIEATKKHILALREKGGTNWSAGYRAGISLFDSLQASLKDPKVYENRIIFLTDAMPNRGELEKEGLFSIAKEAASKHIYTTFIGIGVDFNNELIEAVSKTRGANYYAIHSSTAFAKRLDKEFDYMVTPLVFDLRLTLESKGYTIEAVYGSPEANLATGELMVVNTLFPSPTSQEGSKGGVILLKLKKDGHSQDDDMTLTVSYHDRAGKAYTSTAKASFGKGLYHDNKAIQKAILLSRYVDLMKNFTLDMRQNCHDGTLPPPLKTLMHHCTLYPPTRALYPMVKTWERKSCPLKVSAGYQKIFSLFLRHFTSQAKEIGDHSLEKEEQLLHTLLSHREHKGKIDDWKGER